MRRIVFALCALLGAASAPRPAAAEQPIPLGRWVLEEGTTRMVFVFAADGGYHKYVAVADKRVNEIGTVALEGGKLVLTSEAGKKQTYGFLRAPRKLVLTLEREGAAPAVVAVSLDFGPVVAEWAAADKSMQLALADDGTFRQVVGDVTVRGTYDADYAEPEAVRGALTFRAPGIETASLIFDLGDGGRSLTLTEVGKTEGLRLNRVGGAPAPTPAPGQPEQPKRPKFPGAPTLPGQEPTPAPQPAPGPTPAPAPAPAPAGPVWDNGPLVQDGFKVIRSADEGGYRLWVLEAVTDHSSVLISFAASFYDADGVVIYSSTGFCEPGRVKPGERTRLTMPLPPEGVREKVVQIRLAKRS